MFVGGYMCVFLCVCVRVSVCVCACVIGENRARRSAELVQIESSDVMYTHIHLHLVYESICSATYLTAYLH